MAPLSKSLSAPALVNATEPPTTELIVLVVPLAVVMVPLPVRSNWPPLRVTVPS